MTSNHKTVPHCSEITLEEFKTLETSNHDFQLLDVRQPEEYARGNLQGILIPLNELRTRLKELNPEQLTVVHCQHGVRSQQAAAILLANGFTTVKSLQGGYAAWSHTKKDVVKH